MIIILPSLLLLFTGIAAAATRYVDADCTNGISTYNEATHVCTGGSSLVYSSIQNCANVVNPGDECVVTDGTYTDAGGSEDSIVSLTRSGTSGNEIIFRAENPCDFSAFPPTCGAILDGGASFTRDKGFFLTASGGASYIKIQGFELKRMYYFGIQSGQPSTSHHIYIEGNYVHNIGNVSTPPSPPSAIVEARGGTYWYVDGNMIHDIGRTSTENYGEDHGIYLAGQYSYVRNNIVWGIQRGWPIHLYLNPAYLPQTWDYAWVINNTLDGQNPQKNGQILMQGYGKHAVVDNNIFNDARNSALYLYNSNGSSPNLYIRNNLRPTNVPLITVNTGTPTDYTSSGNQTGSPSFVDSANRDYHIAAGSLAVDAGLESANSPLDDFDGNVRPSGTTVDIGAHERTAGQVPSTYYVDPTDGNDSNTGEGPTAAFKTIGYVNSRTWIAGDVYLFKSGTEAFGSLSAGVNGTSGAHVTIGKYDTGASPIINATRTYSGWTNIGGGSGTCDVNPSTSDTFLSSGTSQYNNDYSAIDPIRVRSYSGSSTGNARSLLSFNCSSIPAGSTITGATLSMYYYAYDTNDPTGRTYYAYRTTGTAWAHNTVTWNCLADANHDGSCDTAWTAPGGDWTATNAASTTVPGSYGWMNWTITNMMQNALDSDSGILRVIVKDNTESATPVKESRFYSNNSVNANKPKIAVTYTSAAANIWSLSAIMTKPDTVKFSGVAGTDVGATCPGDVNSANEWCYDDPNDTLYIYSEADPTTTITGHWNYAITTNGKAYVDIQDINMTGATTANILMSGNNGTLTRSYSHDGSGDCIQITGTGAAVTYSIFDTCTGDGLQLDAGATGATIYNTVSYGNGAQGFNLDETTTIKNSIARTSTGDDININTGKTATAAANIFEDAAKAGLGTYTDGEPATQWSTDPGFADAAGGNFSRTTKDDGANLSLTLDFSLNGVPYCGTPDIGVIEKQTGCTSGRRRSGWGKTW